MMIATLGAMDRSMGVVDVVVTVTAAGVGAFASGWLGLVRVESFLRFGWETHQTRHADYHPIEASYRVRSEFSFVLVSPWEVLFPLPCSRDLIGLSGPPSWTIESHVS